MSLLPVMILTKERTEESTKVSRGREKMGQVKKQRKTNTEVKEMDCAKPTKKGGRVTTRQCDC